MLPASAPVLFLDLLALPRPLALTFFIRLPVDTRLRCCEVSRAWRALLADTTFWASLDLSIFSGRMLRYCLPFFRAAAAKAGGKLRSLITGPQLLEPHYDLLLEIVEANTATLTELRVDTVRYWDVGQLRALLEAATSVPELALSDSFGHRDRHVARAVLRTEPPFQALRMRRLLVCQGLDTTEQVITFCSDLRFHASLKVLALTYVALDTAAAMGAVVDACIALRLGDLDLSMCRVVPAALPELTRLIAAGALRELKVQNDHDEMFDLAHESTRLFVTAVRASAMTWLGLVGLGDVPANVEEAADFINAHRSWKAAPSRSARSTTSRATADSGFVLQPLRLRHGQVRHRAGGIARAQHEGKERVTAGAAPRRCAPPRTPAVVLQRRRGGEVAWGGHFFFSNASLCNRTFATGRRLGRRRARISRESLDERPPCFEAMRTSACALRSRERVALSMGRPSSCRRRRRRPRLFVSLLRRQPLRLLRTARLLVLHPVQPLVLRAAVHHGATAGAVGELFDRLLRLGPVVEAKHTRADGRKIHATTEDGDASTQTACRVGSVATKNSENLVPKMGPKWKGSDEVHKVCACAKVRFGSSRCVLRCAACPSHSRPSRRAERKAF